MAHLLNRVTLLLFVSMAAYCAEQVVDVNGHLTDDSACQCRIVSEPRSSELNEYNQLDDMRTRLDYAEEFVRTTGFTKVLNQLQNLTDRVNVLEDVINEQSVTTSITELFALRKNIDVLQTFMERTNASEMNHEKRAFLISELETIANVTNDMWAKNPYKLKDDYQNEVVLLRERFARCQTDTDLSPFPGDSLPVNVSMTDGWCPGNADLTIDTQPLTHKWEQTYTYNKQGSWFKDPRPLTNASTTEVWQLNRYSSSYTYRLQLYKFPSYKSMLSSSGTSNGRLYVYGWGSVIYGNNLYYFYSSTLYKKDLATNSITSVAMNAQSVDYIGSSAYYVDLKVDEFGLWAIYSTSSDYKLTISKLDPESLLIKNIWVTDVVKTQVCATFMLCGRLYTVKSCTTRIQTAATNNNYVYDTNTSKGYYLTYHVPSLYGSLRQLTYNPRERMLFGWDRAHLVTYAIGWGNQV